MASELEKENFFFFLESQAPLNLLSVPVRGQSGSESLQSLAPYWGHRLCFVD